MSVLFVVLSSLLGKRLVAICDAIGILLLLRLLLMIIHRWVSQSSPMNPIVIAVLVEVLIWI